jgi:hypothetical protein
MVVEVNIRIGLTKRLRAKCCKCGLQNEAMRVDASRCTNSSKAFNGMFYRTAKSSTYSL